MRPVIKYFLCIIATPLLSEFPLHILEFVDEKTALFAAEDCQSGHRTLEHEESARKSLDPDSVPHDSNAKNNLTDVDTTPPRDTAFVTMLAVVGIVILYMLWQVISFTCQMQLSKQESLLFQCFYWSLTLPTAARLMYGLTACATYYVYVHRPRWLLRETPLREQAFQAYAIALAVTMKLLAVVVVGFLVKILVYDNLMKLAVTIFRVKDRYSHVFE
ncbi:uncharacterized protein PV07_00938 [Cladophialophora immunda]|uniref:Uncharacterized protein n=1 Tax=Cladophialophora immunda TaxID=569365 RepID=A0A0D2B949_9EURO|nr:uncharacterized protein PV07_00938 [Cladophialophora immunda]KIW34142.1 hypothetical protein PV07_00938 [Cladophialophora immunda]